MQNIIQKHGHKTNNRIAYNCGDACTISEQINQLQDYDTPDSEVLTKYFINRSYGPKDSVYIFSTCMYFLDDSEFSARMCNFDSESKREISKALRINNQVTDVDIENIETWKLYSALYKILYKYKNKLIYELQEFCYNSNIEKLLEEYMLKVWKNKTYKDVFDYWLKRIKEFLNKCYMIHHNYMETYLANYPKDPFKNKIKPTITESFCAFDFNKE